MENNNFRKFYVYLLVVSVLASTVFGGFTGFLAGAWSSSHGDLKSWLKDFKAGADQTGLSASDGNGGKIAKVDEESSVVKVVEKSSPAVVSIIVTKDLPKIEQYNVDPFGSDFFRQFFGDGGGDFFGIPQYRQNGTQKQEIGGGTGFIVSQDGYIVTNKHVVVDEAAEYTVLMNNEKKYPAKVLARDPVNDLAIIKIDAKDLPVVELGNSANLKAGQTVIAIGNALGEFRNTVSTGVISGLSRSITAGGAGAASEQLTGVIQTDASINPGNSGGPLLNLAGQVIGINTAIAQGAQNIGFAIPISTVKSTIESVKKNGKIIRPWLGVRYVLVTKEIADANKLGIDYGALVVRGENQTDLAVVPGGPADKAGIVENDIILEINGKKIDEKNPLAQTISQMNTGETITLKILHKGEKKEVKVKLEEMK